MPVPGFLPEGAEIARFYCAGAAHACAIAGSPPRIAAGDASGCVHFLALENDEPEAVDGE